MEEKVVGESWEQLRGRNPTLEQVWMEIPPLLVLCLTHSCPLSQDLPGCPAPHRHREQSEERS